jgi:hypothetical protein
LRGCETEYPEVRGTVLNTGEMLLGVAVRWVFPNGGTGTEAFLKQDLIPVCAKCGRVWDHHDEETLKCIFAASSWE